MNVYLDNAATTPLNPQVKSYIIELLEYYQNPSSLYQDGTKIKQLIECTRFNVAKFINTTPDNIYFTPSGSASNTLAINGYYNNNDCCILYSPIAHKSIIKCVESLKHSFQLNVNDQGFIDIIDLKEWLKLQKRKPFVVIDYANSEIGTIQNIEKIIKLVHFYNGVVYLDCTGSISTIPLDVKKINVDMCGFSAHKLGGLKGCGILYKKTNLELQPLIYGSQEKGLIGGTENVLGIVSLGKSIENYNYSSISSYNRNYVYEYIKNNIEENYLIGASVNSKNRLANNLYICFPGVKGESLLTILDMNGIQVSTGSACASIDSSSTTLSAIKLNKKDIDSCIRMSFSGNETKEELDYVCNCLKKCVNSLRDLIK